VASSLEIFNKATMPALRKKSLALTNYLESLLLDSPSSKENNINTLFTLITPSNPEERGAQISIRLEQGLLDTVLEVLEGNSVVIDERKPDVVRVAPAPLYNTFTEVWDFCQIFFQACRKAADVVGR
jgi:kynureninase